ncbi:apolipoprotein M [Hippoglossus hippoglossus]|uniref:apolipoprotein M n=1 Tax=Hippoglossus hippoglossus TaxID=8267 RepID=UPI00148CF718|nr:apolipoprotein M [Hippoglossus hippoglossus]XP_034467861.1 apolipoprotein M [Hippoglossus hippoglossus]XP_035019971.1 apolipoprotein M [Hippoglossus stenolepis]
MMNEALSYFLYLFGLLYQAIAPCSVPELLPANTVNHQQYLGKWFFIAAVSRKEAHIQKFKALDNILFTMEEPANDTLLLRGLMRMGDNCINQTWTYHLHPDRDDLELEGRPQRRNLLWSGKWANCADCIIFQESEPPLKETDTEDSLSRFMLYARQNDVEPEVVKTFLKNSACHNRLANVRLPQTKEFCI